jgi:hypothetical protein
LKGKNAWEWYCDFYHKEITSFPYIVRKIDNCWIHGCGNEKNVIDLYEVYFWVDICVKVEEKFDGFIIVHEKNPSSSLLIEIKLRYDVYDFLVKYVRREFVHLKDKL